MKELFDNKFGIDTYTWSGNEIKKKCPKCNGHNLSCNLSSGKYHCFQCHLGGNLECKNIVHAEKVINYDLQCEMLTWLKDECTLHSFHKDFLIRRGVYNPSRYQVFTIPPQVLHVLQKKYSLTDCLESGLAFRNYENLYKTCAALSPYNIGIPYIIKNKVVALKSRIPPPQDMFSEIKYFIPSGCQIGNKLWLPAKIGADLIITEGEIKAMAACETGLSACAISGIGNSKKVIPLLRKVVDYYNVKRLFIIFDTDIDHTNKKDLIYNVCLLASSFANSTILFLPSDNGKMDLDRYLTNYSVESLIELMEFSWSKKEIVKKNWLARLNYLNHS